MHPRSTNNLYALQKSCDCSPLDFPVFDGLHLIRTRKKKENPSFFLPRAPSMFLNSRRLVRFAGQMNTYFWTASRFFRFLQFTATRHAFARGEAARTEGANPITFCLRGYVEVSFTFWGKGKLIFSPFKIGQTSERPFRPKCLHLTNFVADRRNEKGAPFFVSRRYTKRVLFLSN